MKVIIIRQRDADEKKPVCLVSGRICRDDTDADGVKFFPHPEMIGVTNFQSKKKRADVGGELPRIVLDDRKMAKIL